VFILLSSLAFVQCVPVNCRQQKYLYRLCGARVNEAVVLVLGQKTLLQILARDTAPLSLVHEDTTGALDSGCSKSSESSIEVVEVLRDHSNAFVFESSCQILFLAMKTSAVKDQRSEVTNGSCRIVIL
jgi:hypothetical protein